ncbi:DUF5676 family membrane protein [Parvibaculum sp.]|uniref:DUF5676 family membrane protein n=1 Tax=Parvibaculum sp. TaxID=2024848 RepID=UPI001D8BED06|nr:DUF5676 family membrane protein [Parvibaculum sp.]MBX3488595.1 hypothetical protein [Parvibaculum sp.]
MNETKRIAIVPLGMTLGTFFVVTYIFCVLFGLLVSDPGMHRLLSDLMPGFTWITWPSFFIGLVWSFVFGWYIAIVFTPIYNFFASVGPKSGGA